jgi:hypothetical protein
MPKLPERLLGLARIQVRDACQRYDLDGSIAEHSFTN